LVDGIREIQKLRRELEEAHLFYKAVPCAAKVLGLDYETKHKKFFYLE
jgi:hypothetical protein